jgi:catechol 2,3-dioxygenase-like lactoylglutathione lyase family enzyme
MQIRELSLRTNNLLATTQFYTQVLGLALLDQTPTSIRLSIGTSTLCFKAIQADHSPQYHFAISIPHNQVVFAIDWMKNRADLLPVDNGLIADFRNWNAEAIYFNDNNGNIVEFIGRRDLDNASGQVFSSDSLLAINEAGIPDFSRGPRLPDFTASGTDEGLLIIAQTGRNWYPTSQPAAQEPIQVCLINQGQEIHIHFN